jgi:hypothetical protein
MIIEAMRHIHGTTYVHVAPTGITVFGRRRRPRAAIVRQPTPLPALGVNPTTDRQIILVLQQQLRGLGYQTAVTGRVGVDTRAAINAFAQAAYVSVDGPDTDRIVAVDRVYGERFDHSHPFDNDNPYVR